LLRGAMASASLSPYTTLFRSKHLLQDMFDHVASASKSWSERLRVTRATGDWRSLWNMVSPFGVSLFSAYRPGARTATGFQSKHRSEEHTSELQSREKLVCRHL